MAAELGLSDELAAFADENTPVRDALWFCDTTIGPDGNAVTFDQRISEIRTCRSDADPTVRALAHNLTERAAAFQRTEYMLRDSSGQLIGSR